MTIRGKAQRSTRSSQAGDKAALADFRPLPAGANPNAHTPRGLGMLDDAMARQGYVAPMTAAADGAVLDGNARLETAVVRFDGVAPLVVEHDGTRPVIMVRTDIPNAEHPMARDIIVSANRITEADLSWDTDVLKALQADGVDLSGLWGEDELAELLGAEPAGGLTDPDDVPAERATDIKLGDLFELGGRHRLLCGDSTKPEDVARLMDGEKADACISDPPYGVGIDTDYTRLTHPGVLHRRTNHKKIHGDEKPFDPTPLLAFDAVVLFGANYFAATLPRGTWLVWDKRFKNGEAWLSDAELAWMKTGTGVYIFALTSQGFVRPEAVEHPTQKPVALIVWCMEKAKAGAVVYDPYLGSGTTIIACQQTDRSARAIEIEPSYCQVAIDRWEAFTGQTATKVGEAVAA